MSRTSSDDQITFLLSCVKYSNHGKVDFAGVAKEAGVISRGAASKRYERLVRSHGPKSSEGSPTKPEPKSKKRSTNAMAKAAEAKRRKIEEDSSSLESDKDSKCGSPGFESFGNPSSVINSFPGLQYDGFGFPMGSRQVMTPGSYNSHFFPTIPTTGGRRDCPNQVLKKEETFAAPWPFWLGTTPPYSPILGSPTPGYSNHPGPSASTTSDPRLSGVRDSQMMPLAPTMNVDIPATFIKPEPETALPQTPTTAEQTKSDTSPESANMDAVLGDFINSDLFMPPPMPQNTVPPAPQKSDVDNVPNATSSSATEERTGLDVDGNASRVILATQDILGVEAIASNIPAPFKSDDEQEFIAID